jgi:membrane protease YdiL (CAAX protease family)
MKHDRLSAANMMTTQADPNARGEVRFGKSFLALFGLGFIGVLALIPLIIRQVDALPPETLPQSKPVIVLLSLLNPLLLLALAVAIGTLLAHRVGLRSLIAEKVRTGAAIWPQLRPQLITAFVIGLVFAGAVLGLDALLNPFAGTELANAAAAGEPTTIGALLSQLALGILYGGITEELLLRWGIMTLLVWLGWRVVQRGRGAPHPALVWTAIVLAALLFGIGHLPAMASLVALTPLIIFRTVLLNALGGLIFGWLYWRRSLEVAMVAHAAGHVGFFLVNVGLLVMSLW